MIEGKKITQLPKTEKLNGESWIPVVFRGATRKVLFSVILNHIIAGLPDHSQKEIVELKGLIDGLEQKLGQLEKDKDNSKEFDEIDRQLREIYFKIQGQDETIIEYTAIVRELKKLHDEASKIDITIDRQLNENSENAIMNKAVAELVPPEASPTNQLADKAFVKSEVKETIKDITGFDFRIVEELPTNGDKGIIYLVPIKKSETWIEMPWIEMPWSELASQLSGVTTITNDRKTEGVTVSGTTANIYNVKVSGDVGAANKLPDTLVTADLTGLDTSKMFNIGGMFYNCSKLTSLNLTGFDTSFATRMGSMFYGCSKLTSLNLTGFDTSNIWNMFAMFANCTNLTTLDLSTWNTVKVTRPDEMFGHLNNVTIKVGKGWTLSTASNAYLGTNLTFDVTDTEPNKPVTSEPNKPVTSEPEPIEPQSTETDLYEEYIWLGDKYEMLGRKNEVIDTVEAGNMNPVTSNAVNTTLENQFPNYSHKELIYKGTDERNMTYTAPANGWITCSGYGNNTIHNFVYVGINGVYHKQQGYLDESITLCVPVRKGSIISIWMWLSVDNCGLYFVYND